MGISARIRRSPLTRGTIYLCECQPVPAGRSSLEGRDQTPWMCSSRCTRASPGRGRATANRPERPSRCCPNHRPREGNRRHDHCGRYPPAVPGRSGARANASGVAERVKALNMSMLQLSFPPESFDLIWSEGAIYIMGFGNGLTAWKPLLRRGGYVVVSELS